MPSAMPSHPEPCQVPCQATHTHLHTHTYCQSHAKSHARQLISHRGVHPVAATCAADSAMPSHTHSHTSHKPTPCQTTRIPCHTNTFGHARKPCNSACKCASETETDFVLQGSQANSRASRGLQAGFCASVTHATGPLLALGIRTEICPSDGPGAPEKTLAPWKGRILSGIPVWAAWLWLG